MRFVPGRCASSICRICLHARSAIERRTRLMQAADSINATFGRGTVQPAETLVAIGRAVVDCSKRRILQVWLPHGSSLVSANVTIQG